MSHWKRNVVFIWASQFLSIMGFAFAMPFAPYFLQELGVTEPQQLKLWIALFGAATPLALAVFSPVWGILGDRFGRRMMLLRANLAAAVILALMSMVVNPMQLVFLRCLQGVFTGTMTAAQAMVAVQAPRQRSGLALGTLSACVYSGAMAGSFLGGVTAELFGYRAAFCVSSWLLLAAGCLVIFGTDDGLSRLDKGTPDAPLFQMRMPRLGAGLPILLLMMAMAFVRQFDRAFLPLLVQEIHGSLDGVAIRTGTLGMVGGVAGFFSGIIMGRLADRISPTRIAIYSALGAGILMLSQSVAGSMTFLFASRFAAVFCAGGLDPLFQIWLVKVTPEERRGALFGWAGTARALGWMAAPLISGAVAAIFDIRAIFVVAGLLFVLLIPQIRNVVRRLGS